LYHRFLKKLQKFRLGNFQYHTTLRGKGSCSNRQSAVIWGGLAKSSYNFYDGWKSL